VKTKPKGCVEVGQKGNNELIIGYDVFQLGELVNPYRVAPSNNFKKKIQIFTSTRIFLLMLTLMS
jgi:hypothetical protein